MRSVILLELGIRGVQTECSPWKSRQEKNCAQIDMLIVRADNVIDVCEMKFSSDEYTITAGYDRELRHIIELFNNETKCKQTVHLIIITTFGLKFNEYSGQVQQIVTMDDFFKLNYNKPFCMNNYSYICKQTDSLRL